jgi:hypothetical protein
MRALAVIVERLTDRLIGTALTRHRMLGKFAQKLEARNGSACSVHLSNGS